MAASNRSIGSWIISKSLDCECFLDWSFENFLAFFVCVCVLLTRFPFSMLFVCSDGDEGSPFHMAKFGLFPSLVLRICGLFGSLELGGVLELENSSRVCVLVCARHFSNSFR